ncbi:von Willebrand factor A domain-containing protein 5A [Paramecium bursaria]
MQIDPLNITKTFYLLTAQEEKPIPLKNLNFEVNIFQCQANITIQQEYFNDSNHATNTIFVFPVETGNAFSKLTMRINDEEFETIIEERQKAEQKFVDSVQKKTAVIGTYKTISKSDDLFKIKLGNIPPKNKILITILVFQTLSLEDMSYCFRLPLKYIPRYQPQRFITKDNFQNVINQNQETLEDNQQLGQYVWNLTINLETVGILKRCQSNYEIEIAWKNSNQAIINSKNFQEKPEQDFKLLFTDSSIGNPIALSGSIYGDVGIILSLIPDFRSDELKQQQEQLIQKNGYKFPQEYVMAPTNQEMILPLKNFDKEVCDYYFLIDRSGSMNGESIQFSVEAIKLFIYSLPMGSMFNIYSFGTEYQKLFLSVAKYDDQTQEQAIKMIEQFQADLGGTELLKPLSDIYQEIKKNNKTSQIFLLTDGCVDDESAIVQLIQDNKSYNIRLHTFGIGSGVSTSLVKNCAQTGGGMFYFINSLEDIEEFVIEALQLNLLPYLRIDEINLVNSQDQAIKLKEKFTVSNGGFFQHKIFLEDYQEEIKLLHLKFFYPNTNQFHDTFIDVIKHPMLNENIMATVVKAEIDRIPLDGNKIHYLSLKHQVISKFTSFFVAHKIIDKYEKLDLEGDDHQTIEVQVKTLTGKSYFITLNNDDKVEDLKFYIQDVIGIPYEQQRLVFNVKVLEDDMRIFDFNIHDGSVIHLVLRLRDGGGSATRAKKHALEIISPSKEQKQVKDVNYKQIVFLQKAQGYWDERIITTYLKQQNIEQFMKNQVLSNLDNIIIFTLLALKLLRKNFMETKKLWSMIQQKAIKYLILRGLTNEQIESSIEQIIL